MIAGLGSMLLHPRSACTKRLLRLPVPWTGRLERFSVAPPFLIVIFSPLFPIGGLLGVCVYRKPAPRDARLTVGVRLTIYLFFLALGFILSAPPEKLATFVRTHVRPHVIG